MQIEWRQGFPKKGEVGLFWLGQAGFWLETGQYSILIDPYLSDSLAHKYAGKKHDHVRMMPPPISVAHMPKPDMVLVTHAHTDHMDPDTLGPLQRQFPGTIFVVPKACIDIARDRIGATATLIEVCADQQVSPLEGLTLSVFPAAHEDLRRDEDGNHVFLGYGIEVDGFRLYHSGDSIPYEGLQERIDRFAPNVALLPVNGRDAARLADGIPGNFTLQEAIDLCGSVPILIPHHFGMFAFNTIERDRIELAAKQQTKPRIIVPEVGQTLHLGRK